MFTTIYWAMSWLGALAIIAGIVGAFSPAAMRSKVVPPAAAAFLFAVLILLALPESAIP